MRWTSAGAAAPPRSWPRFRLFIGLVGLGCCRFCHRWLWCFIFRLFIRLIILGCCRICHHWLCHARLELLGMWCQPSHRMWCPSGSVWQPKMCRTNAISARPFVPGGAIFHFAPRLGASTLRVTYPSRSGCEA